MTETQIFALISPFVLAFIGAVWGISRSMGRKLISNFEHSISKLENSIDKLATKFETINEFGIKHNERINNLEKKINIHDEEIKHVQKEISAIREHHFRNHPDDRI